MTRHPQSGLTQLELMVSLACMALLTVGLANALDFSRQFLTHSSAQAAATEHLLTRRQLRQWAADIPTIFGTHDGAYFLTGTDQSLNLRTLARDGSFWPGEAAEVALLFDPNKGLWLEAVGFQDTENRETRILPLDPAATTLKLSYFGRRSDEPSKTWHSNWSDARALPDLVKLEWTGANNGAVPPLTLFPGQRMRQMYMELETLIPRAP